MEFLIVFPKMFYYIVFAFFTLLSLIINVPAELVGGNNINNVEKLPFCGNEAQRDVSRRLLFVTTLDGKLSALDLSREGFLKWSLSTTPGPLLSSSIHRLELTNNGQWVRMIPSLNGGLYKFDRESIEPVPVTVDHLLSSSFKFSDDLVISGGKETRSYGVSSRTGKIIYECSINGCKNNTNSDDFMDSDKHGPPRASATADDTENDTEHDPLIDDVIVVRRQTQTVRAVEPRTGGERWNFSVGHHEMEILKTEDCHQRPYSDADKALLDLELKVIVPEGIICAVNKNKPNVILWKYKFDHPIVSAWRTDKNDHLESIDLFSSSQWIWNSDNDNMIEQSKISPALYIGMFNKQLYIQESVKLRELALRSANQINDHLEGKKETLAVLRIPWKPFPATTSALALIEEDILTDPSVVASSNGINSIHINDVDLDSNLDTDESTSVTALSVLYASEYINGNGFYLYSDIDVKITHSGRCDSHNHSLSEANIEIIRTLFAANNLSSELMKIYHFYWKEVLVIMLTSLLICNVMISKYFRSPPEILIVEKHIQIPITNQQEQQKPSSSSETHIADIPDNQKMPSDPQSKESSTPSAPPPNSNSPRLPSTTTSSSTGRSQSESNGDNFHSRFCHDFDMVQCLGRGGFGVVFEAKNKLDDCNYAIKRIILPNKQESRDRVMREVKTLANCDHKNIVRYFQAWVEQPPPGWQEQEDKLWMDRETSSHCIDIDSPTSELPPKNYNGFSNLILSSGDDEPLDTEMTSENIGCKLPAIKPKSVVAKTHGGYIFNNYSKDIIKCNKSFGRNNGDNDDSDSFEIEFEHSKTNGDNNDNTNNEDDEDEDEEDDDDEDEEDVDDDICFTNSTSQYKKNRAQSECTDYVISMDSCSENKENSNSICFINDITSNNSNNNNSKITALKKTHSRPKSLDLSARRGSFVRPAITLPPPPPLSRMYLYIQMQLCKKQSLKDWLRLNDSNMRQSNILPIFEQIVDAVEYVHLKGLIHRDLKPSNIFFSLDGQIKIGDFGLVTDMSDNLPNISNNNNNNTNNGSSTNCPKFIIKHTEQVGTHLYMSPEQIHGQQYNYKVDIYSLGLIFFELLITFGTEMERIETLKSLRLQRFPIDFHNEFPDEHNLLKLMLSNLPDQRPTTFGIRSMKPLNHVNELNTIEFHFELPPRRRDSVRI